MHKRRDQKFVLNVTVIPVTNLPKIVRIGPSIVKQQIILIGKKYVIISKSTSFRLSELKGDIILDQVCTRLHNSVINAPLENGYSLHICQQQTLSWAHNLEINGTNIPSTCGNVKVHNGMICDEMGMVDQNYNFINDFTTNVYYSRCSA